MALVCSFIKNEFFRIYYPKIVATDTDKPFTYLQRNLFVGHLPDKGFYNELVTAFYNKKILQYLCFRVQLGFTESK